jgi:hypothetical protein
MTTARRPYGSLEHDARVCLAASTVARPELATATRIPTDSSRSSSSPTRLAAGSQLGDELLGLVQLAAEPGPLLGLAAR